MTHRARTLGLILLLASPGGALHAQSTSLRQRHATTQPAANGARENADHKGNRVLERRSLIAVAPQPPKTYKLHDLITVIVREQRRYEADGQLDSRRQWQVQSELDAFIKHIEGGVGAAAFRRGKPNIDYSLTNRLRAEAGKEREDRLTTRITAEILDVKPNGTLVLQARNEVAFDNEKSIMTLTGTCRKDDVTPDNTLLSTQLADLRIHVENHGAVREGSRRGWIQRGLDFLRIP